MLLLTLKCGPFFLATTPYLIALLSPPVYTPLALSFMSTWILPWSWKNPTELVCMEPMQSPRMWGSGANLDQGPCSPIQTGKRQGGWRASADHPCIESGERGQQKSTLEWYLMSDSRARQAFNREDGLLVRMGQDAKCGSQKEQVGEHWCDETKQGTEVYLHTGSGLPEVGAQQER